MEVCYANVGLIRWWTDLSPEGQAGWLSAIGGLAAVFLTMAFYFLDRWRERKIRRQELQRLSEDEARALATSQQAKAASAWKQAVLLHPIVTVGIARLETMKSILTNGNTVSAEQKYFFEVPDLERFAKLLTDSSAFSPDIEERLLAYIAQGSLQNTLFSMGLRARGDGYTVGAALAGEKGMAEVNMIQRIAEDLLRALRQIISARAISIAHRTSE